MDGIIQDNSPLFVVMWVSAAVLYLGGVQLPTAAVNIPLNNRVQELQIDQLDTPAAARE